MINGAAGQRRTIISPNRPVAPPPAPPPGLASRDSLPPPPSPPPGMDYNVDGAPTAVSPPAGRLPKPGSVRESPVRQGLR